MSENDKDIKLAREESVSAAMDLLEGMEKVDTRAAYGRLRKSVRNRGVRKYIRAIAAALIPAAVIAGMWTYLSRNDT